MLRLPHYMLTKTNGNVYFLAYGIYFSLITIMGLYGALLTKGTCTNNTINEHCMKPHRHISF